jgi:hypothetical protein
MGVLFLSTNLAANTLFSSKYLMVYVQDMRRNACRYPCKVSGLFACFLNENWNVWTNLVNIGRAEQISKFMKSHSMVLDLFQTDRHKF